MSKLVLFDCYLDDEGHYNDIISSKLNHAMLTEYYLCPMEGYIEPCILDTDSSIDIFNESLDVRTQNKILSFIFNSFKSKSVDERDIPYMVLVDNGDSIIDIEPATEDKFTASYFKMLIEKYGDSDVLLMHSCGDSEDELKDDLKHMIEDYDHDILDICMDSVKLSYVGRIDTLHNTDINRFYISLIYSNNFPLIDFGNNVPKIIDKHDCHIAAVTPDMIKNECNIRYKNIPVVVVNNLEIWNCRRVLSGLIPNNDRNKYPILFSPEVINTILLTAAVNKSELFANGVQLTEANGVSKDINNMREFIKLIKDQILASHKELPDNVELQIYHNGKLLTLCEIPIGQIFRTSEFKSITCFLIDQPYMLNTKNMSIYSAYVNKYNYDINVILN